MRPDRALSCYRLGELAEARALAEEVLAGGPGAAEQARAWNVLGMVALAQGQASEGPAAFTRGAEVAAAAEEGETSLAALHHRSLAQALIERLDQGPLEPCQVRAALRGGHGGLPHQRPQVWLIADW